MQKRNRPGFWLAGFILLLLASKASGQEKIWVFFRDKPGTTFSAVSYFDPAALERRERLGLPDHDEYDLPVSVEYIADVEKLAGKVEGVSRWLNAVTLRANRKEQTRIEALPFVSEICPAGTYSVPDHFRRSREFSFQKEALKGRALAQMEVSVFDSLQLDGTGVRIAVFDAGFPDVDRHPLFSRLRNEHRILDTWDFVRDHADVYRHNLHGTMVLSCIAGISGDDRLGLATGAEFLLARTEKAGEPFSEEENWIEAMEWADRHGADIISSSLGYSYHRYFRDQMDGKTSPVARAANIAARKGILVVNAMGNDGMNRWGIVSTPADADSVLSVGGTDPYTGMHISFSSFGPAADGTAKPDVCAPAQTLVAGRKGIRMAFGTSFSTPLVAGFAACVKQMHPDWSAMELMQQIRQSGHLSPYFDYAHGFGIPQASYFAEGGHQDSTAMTLTRGDGFIEIHIGEDRGDHSRSLPDYFYYHIARPDGIIRKYGVLKVSSGDSLFFPRGDLGPGEWLRIHYRDQTETIYSDQQ